MIIFKNHLFSCSYVTVILLSLQIVNVHANKASVVLCSSEAQFYKCSDGKKHTINGKTYHLKSSQERPSVAAIDVRKKGTVVNASQITVQGDNPNEVFTSGVYVAESGKVILTDSNFKNTFGLSAKDAVISMTNGSIEGSPYAIYASGEKADIALVFVNIGPGDSNINYSKIISINGAMVRMASSTVNFNGSGGFEAIFRGKFLLDNITVKGQGVIDDESVYALPVDGENAYALLSVAFDVSQGSNVHLRDNSIQLTDMHGFWITTLSGFADINGRLIQKYDSSDDFKKTSINIERSNIVVQGERAHGLFFDSLDPKTLTKMLGRDDEGDEVFSKVQTVIGGQASVHLSQTTLTVPDGIAIYSTGPDGYGADAIIELTKGTKISGDLLLKAENNSSIFVSASASSLKGGIRVEDISIAILQLMRGSTWFLTKGKKRFPESASTDSLLSSIILSDSTIVFDENVSDGYQTLRIGSEIDRIRSEIDEVDVDELSRGVYNAEGNVQIKLSAFLNNDGSFDAKKADRILIYGSVWGTTLLQVQNVLRLSEKKVIDVKGLSDGQSSSVSLIQVAGTAQEDSFKLIDNYTTINGLPYQYRLRAYGPGSSFGKADVKQRLVAGDGDFWDFRLESVYINPKPSSSEFEPTLPPSDKPISISVTPVSSPASPSEPTVPSTSVESAPVPVPSAPPLSPLSTLSVSSESPSVNPKFAPSFPVSSETSSASIPVPPLSTSPSLSSGTVSRELLTDSKSVPADSLELSPSSPDPSVSSASVAPLSTPSVSALSPSDSMTKSSEPVESSPTDPTSTPLKPVIPSPSEPIVPSTSVESAPVPVPSAPPLSTLSVSSESPSVNPKFSPSFPVSSETSSASIPIPPPSTSPSLSSGTVFRELLTDSKSVPADSLELSPSSPDPSVSALSPSDSMAKSSEPVESSPTDPTSTPLKPVIPSPPDSTVAPSVSVKQDIHPKPRIRAVVPQFPTYLFLPNALFYAGLMDLTTQNKKLLAMRTASHISLKSDENSAFFARGYGGSHHYVSNLSVFEYGYGAELDYNALEAGVLLKEIESLYGRTLFGVTVTYGNLFLNPRDVLESKKNIFDKLSVSTYGSLQHDTSFYMDGVFSYGLFRGDVFTLARGKTATLKGKQLSTSLTSGKAFATGHNGLIFDPQVQIIYQNLQFYKAHDVDNLDVDLGKFHQWTVRIGGRLTKTLIAHEHITHEEARVVSLYGKFYLLHSFGDRQFVSFKKAFELGMFGSSLEAGLGFNAQLFQKFALHGDITYQHRLTKAGFSGASLSGGLSYYF